MDAFFEQKFAIFLEDQRSKASARRLEMLERDLTGTIKLLREVIWPIFRSFEGIELEYEMRSPNGVTMFIDVFYLPYCIAFECDGYSAHVETITRERFNFEKSRVRSMLLKGYAYVPFSWDELDKKSAFCRSFVYELLGRYSSSEVLTLYEREIIRYAAQLNRPFRLNDICDCLGKKRDFSMKTVASLMQKQLIQPARPLSQRIHEYVLSEGALRQIR
ncbi:hypothetical protein D3P07_06145 [Paenibacillus sp. 1011MAR3C5]|uniref:hypothetical protein n=1 Tax=Paenibacillus sp. 1011MAR3C5 TaxID=1675787 RepID=UPI000E6C16E0|nr:hypothetical protein [Paenibacillus sp. 1011MAR3C5]RJE89807.1 hypothetical protein D3P07_06145 [Paenibacillus sp. 1011MAR3C5]